MASEDLTDAIAENAAGPRQAAADGVSAQQHSLPDQIAADKHLGSKQAMAINPVFSVFRVKMIPAGAG